MITYLDEMNRKSMERHRKSTQAIRRSSIETAEFMHEDMLSRRKNTQTIDVDLSHREQLDQ
jgi:hypothetical protein